MTDKMREALPCPFCGSDNVSDGELLCEIDGNRFTQSECMSCGAIGPKAQRDGPDYGNEKAIAAWNTRQAAQSEAVPVVAEYEPEKFRFWYEYEFDTKLDDVVKEDGSDSLLTGAMSLAFEAGYRTAAADAFRAGAAQAEQSAELERLRKDAERLRDALRYYGTHSNACDMSRFVSPAGCTCGYDAAIAAEGEKK